MELFFVIIGTVVLSVFVVIGGLRRRDWKVPAGAKARLRSQWKSACALPDPARRVLDCDNVLSAALREVGVPGGLGAQLKIAGARFRNKEALWRAHKLRNRIAHEPGVRVSEKEAEVAMRAFERGMEYILR